MSLVRSLTPQAVPSTFIRFWIWLSLLLLKSSALCHLRHISWIILCLWMVRTPIQVESGMRPLVVGRFDDFATIRHEFPSVRFSGRRSGASNFEFPSHRRFPAFDYDPPPIVAFHPAQYDTQNQNSKAQTTGQLAFSLRLSYRPSRVLVTFDDDSPPPTSSHLLHLPPLHSS